MITSLTSTFTTFLFGLRATYFEVLWKGKQELGGLLLTHPA